MRLIILALIILFSTSTNISVSANTSNNIEFNSNQVRLLKLTRDLVYNKDHVAIMQGILLRETYANPNSSLIVGDSKKTFGERSYGVFQVKLNTASYVIQKRNLPFTFKTKEQLLAKLLTDDSFNTVIAYEYFLYLLERYNGNIAIAISAYNIGPTTMDKEKLHKLAHSTPYVIGVKNYIRKEVRIFNANF